VRATRLVLTTATLVLLTTSAVQAQIAHGYSNVFAFDTVTAVDDGGSPPLATALTSIHPNPFNPRTTIEFTLAEPGVVELAVFDLRGRLIRKLDHEYRSAGHYQVTWSGQDWSGRSVPTGTYFCRLIAAGKSQTAKVTLAK
jgi:hypothetical protein